MSGSRREFDVKRILKLRWRGLGHQQPPPNPDAGGEGDLWGRRRNAAAAGGIKFLNASSLPPSFASLGFRRSKPQGSLDSFARPMASKSGVPSLDFSREDIQTSRLLEDPDAEGGAGEEEEAEEEAKVSNLIACRSLLSHCSE
ncbi:hypothetical protein Chor_010890 [Crotalus horridus]